MKTLEEFIEFCKLVKVDENQYPINLELHHLATDQWLSAGQVALSFSTYINGWIRIKDARLLHRTVRRTCGNNGI